MFLGPNRPAIAHTILALALVESRERGKLSLHKNHELSYRALV